MLWELKYNKERGTLIKRKNEDLDSTGSDIVSLSMAIQKGKI